MARRCVLKTVSGDCLSILLLILMNLAQRKWTMPHGHLGMGGITTVGPAFEDGNSENPEGQVLTPEQYTRLTSGAQGITPFKSTKITVSDIKNRSKGDFLSKAIAIL